MFDILGWGVEVGGTVRVRHFDDFDCMHVEGDATALLAAFGISTEPADGRVIFWIDHGWRWWRELGHVVVDGSRIQIWPHHGVTDTDMAVLRGAACEAFCTPPSTHDAWIRRGRLWECSISVPAD
ncbi:hypothetical protein [Nocardia farcinica]|uniref:hypothetical protein n=1 Tax=Nocardia farcinica TaxID=37329 RepID=UPI0024539BC3|nr:hypothetical protein [Nocardia farcinica]